MRLCLPSLCVASAACVVDVSSHAGLSDLAIRSARPPFPADHFKGQTKRYLRVHESADEERAVTPDGDPITALIAKYFTHHVEPIVDTTTLPVKSIVSRSTIYTPGYKELIESNISPFELYEALGLADQVVSNLDIETFQAMNNYLLFFKWDRLRSYTKFVYKTQDKIEEKLHPLYLKFCQGNEKAVEEFRNLLNTFEGPKCPDGLKWLKAAKTPQEVLVLMEYPGTGLIGWKDFSQWTKYVDLYNVAYDAARKDLDEYTKHSDLDLLEMVVNGEEYPQQDLLWVLNGLIEYWRDKSYSPFHLYGHLGLMTTVVPDFSSKYFAAWVRYVHFSSEDIAAELEFIYPRAELVKVLTKNDKTDMALYIKFHFIEHLERVKQNQRLPARISEVETFLKILRESEVTGRSGY